MFGSPAMFQQLMDRIFRPHAAYAHMKHLLPIKHLRAVPRSLRHTGLTENIKKCAIQWVQLWYLGFYLGHGLHSGKTAAIMACLRPKTKK